MPLQPQVLDEEQGTVEAHVIEPGRCCKRPEQAILTAECPAAGILADVDNNSFDASGRARTACFLFLLLQRCSPEVSCDQVQDGLDSCRQSQPGSLPSERVPWLPVCTDSQVSTPRSNLARPLALFRNAGNSSTCILQGRKCRGLRRNGA